MPLVLTKWAINRRGLVSCRLNRATVYIFDSITNDGGKTITDSTLSHSLTSHNIDALKTMELGKQRGRQQNKA